MATGRVPTTANSPLTAKGDLFTYSTAPARLAVGNNGETLVADSSTSTGLRYQSNYAAGKNAIINGAFDIWQRGTSIANDATYTKYCADRFQINRGGLETGITVSQQATNDTTNLPFIRYAARVQRNNGNATTGTISFLTSLETSNSIRFAGQTITVSFYARKGSNFSQASSQLNAVVSTGTGTDQSLGGGYTGQSTVLNQTATLTTTWQRFSFSGTVSSSATEIGVWFYYVPSGTAGANDYFEITGIQLEAGSVATAFQTATGTIQGELAACQRYYQRYNFPTATGGGTNVGTAVNTTIFDTLIIPPVAFRVTPTAIDSLTLSMYYPPVTGQYNTGTFTITSFSTANHIDIRYTHGSAVFTAGIGGFLTSSANNGYLGLTAEL